jgi:hypothetical protein
MKKENVDLDAALRWICDEWKAVVHDRTDERLAALFTAADADGNGDLDFKEFSDLTRKLSKEKTGSITTRQMIRMYGYMALSNRIDAPLFVACSRAYGLGAFVLGTDDDSAATYHSRSVFDQFAADLAKSEPVILDLISRDGDGATGRRAAQNLSALRCLVQEGREVVCAGHVLALTIAECEQCVAVKRRDWTGAAGLDTRSARQ